LVRCCDHVSPLHNHTHTYTHTHIYTHTHTHTHTHAHTHTHTRTNHDLVRCRDHVSPVHELPGTARMQRSGAQIGSGSVTVPMSMWLSMCACMCVCLCVNIVTHYTERVTYTQKHIAGRKPYYSVTLNPSLITPYRYAGP
jgi:ABC-type Zn2+ transport system substrate-binding protein/surface adhesin